MNRNIHAIAFSYENYRDKKLAIELRALKFKPLKLLFIKKIKKCLFIVEYNNKVIPAISGVKYSS